MKKQTTLAMALMAITTGCATTHYATMEDCKAQSSWYQKCYVEGEQPSSNQLHNAFHYGQFDDNQYPPSAAGQPETSTPRTRTVTVMDSNGRQCTYTVLSGGTIYKECF
jgi:hypothetical protein